MPSEEKKLKGLHLTTRRTRRNSTLLADTSLCQITHDGVIDGKENRSMERPGTLGVCVADSSGLSLSARGSLTKDVAPLASHILSLCSQLEPSNNDSPQVALLSDHCKVTLSIQDDHILALHQKS
ncbi:hypothetical protein DICVIV_06140 [Dictyocaulus viviparus]|uniref:Late endosomal/lysosomal adaptor and MAPK and MTOR activator 5 n=1 Tax=Dictyocaulus viviparus TaxID=29172 RepID=A0A0D8XVF0_DICVI|nr:hypothetical protein DICVIV_06140 [Dictyocaulus viviparus]